MTEKEFLERIVDLNTEFMQYAVSHPEILDKIPQDAQLVFLPTDDPEFCRRNEELIQREGIRDKPIVYIRMRRVPEVRTVMVTVPEVDISH